MNQPTCVAIDILQVKPSLLASTNRVTDYITTTCKLFNLKQIGTPNVHKFSGGGEGITATQILGASLFSLHTYPEHGVIYIDVFSCESFDYLGLFEHTKRYWESQMAFLERIHRVKV